MSARLLRDPIFYRDLGILLRPSRRLEFWPSPELSLEEKVNATVRFLLYAGVLLYASTLKPKYVVLSWAAIAVLGVLYGKGGGEGKEAFRDALLHGSVSAAAVQGTATRPRTRENPFANVLHADPHADLPAPEWDEDEAAKATKLFRSKMYMDITDVSGVQSSERQFMQMPEQDMDAFMQFLMQKHQKQSSRMTDFVVPRMSSVDADAQAFVRSTEQARSAAKLEPLAAPLKPMTVDRAPLPVSLENSLRTESVSRDGRHTKLDVKWELERMGGYVQAAPLRTAAAATATSTCTQSRRLLLAGQELMYAPAIGRPTQADWRLDAAPISRARLDTVALLNPASGMRQAAGAAHQAQATRMRQPFRSDDTPMLFNASSTRDPLPIYKDSDMRAPSFSHFRGDGSSLRGRNISMNNLSTFREPYYLKEPSMQLTRFRGPTRTSQMVFNQSIRPDIAQMLPIGDQPRAEFTRLSDVVKDASQTMDEAALHAVGRAMKDVDLESSIYSTALTHDGKKHSTEAQVRDILPPVQEEAYMPVSQLQATTGVSTRFSSMPLVQ
ncbi:hypothetical protein OEZ85_011040 [Tetradesmus obliquus]|uniref:Minor capsid protein P9 transmembrane helices domain-containing protein n=1 Tax=Tetradesmus obliquus TaxID=3088 RepID=A0ABY8TP25_TETOB|nr:hypothetical protein OEZ85_011040 [Tetradesmus obliquus]